MKLAEFLSFLKQTDAYMAHGADERSIQIANGGLQNISAAILPLFMLDFYKVCSATVLSGSYIFGPSEIKTIDLKHPIPSIFEINKEFSHVKHMRGKTIFARNDLFMFAFDSFGTVFMLDNVTLQPIREYKDSIQAMYDCIIIGKL